MVAYYARGYATPTAPSSGSGSSSDQGSPNLSPVLSSRSSTISNAKAHGRRRRFPIHDLPISPTSAKRRLIFRDVIHSLERSIPSYMVLLIALLVVFNVMGGALTNSAVTLDISQGAFGTFGAQSARHSNAEMVAEIANWKDAEYTRSRLRVYYYDLPEKFNQALVMESHTNPPQTRDPFCDESFYSAEHTLSEFFKNSAVRTMDASEADYFYVPILTTCYLLTNLPNNLEKTGAFFESAMDIVINEYPFWKRSDGRDHILMFAQGFGARLTGNWTKYRHATFLVHNGDYEEDHFDTHKDIVVPPDLSHYFQPVGLTHPHKLLPKKNFVLFGGQILNSSISDHRGSNYSGGVRQFISSNLSSLDGYKVTGVRSKTYIKDMMESVFCLAPHGWHKWSPRPAYSVLLGCIPVLISEKQELFLEDIIDYSKISYWVRPDEVRDLDSKLRNLGHEVLTEHEFAMREVWKLFWYGPHGLAQEAVLYSLFRKLGSSRPGRLYI